MSFTKYLVLMGIFLLNFGGKVQSNNYESAEYWCDDVAIKDLSTQVKQLKDANEHLINVVSVSLMNTLQELKASLERKMEDDSLHLKKDLREFKDSILQKYEENYVNSRKMMNEIKELIDLQNENGKTESLTLQQHLVDHKDKLIEFKDVIRNDCSTVSTKVSNLTENVLSTLKEKHILQNGSLHDIKELIKFNQLTAANEGHLLKQELKEHANAVRNVSYLLEDAKMQSIKKLSNCADVPYHESGIYQLYLPQLGHFDVYCHSDPHNGRPWTIVQRRQNNLTDFNRDWQEYKHGFGNANDNYWIGLEKIYALTRERKHELWISLEDFNGNRRSANYSAFAISNETNKYAIKVLGVYKGDAADSMREHFDQKFSTFDNDNDNSTTANCAKSFKSGWWFYSCYMSNLNGKYLYGQQENGTYGIAWNNWLGRFYSLKYVHMAIRPVNQN